MSLDVTLDDDHTIDIGPLVIEDPLHPGSAIQGILLKKEYTVTIDHQPYCVLRCIGITRAEMELAQQWGAAALTSLLTFASIYPHTLVDRESMLCSHQAT